MWNIPPISVRFSHPAGGEVSLRARRTRRGKQLDIYAACSALTQKHTHTHIKYSDIFLSKIKIDLPYLRVAWRGVARALLLIQPPLPRRCSVKRRTDNTISGRHPPGELKQLIVVYTGKPITADG